MSAAGKIFEQIIRARDKHDAPGGCEYGNAKADRVFLTPFDCERLGWEEGDDIGGLTLYADLDRPRGTLRISCPNEISGTPTGVATVANEQFVVGPVPVYTPEPALV